MRIPLSLGHRTRQRILEDNSFGYDTVDAQAARVTLSEPPLKEVPAGKGWVYHYEMEPDAIEALIDWLELRCVVPYKANDVQRRAARSFERLRGRLEREMTQLENFPAYHGIAMLDTQVIALPAWELRGVVRPTKRRLLLELGDIEGARFGLLYPQTAQRRGRPVTTWSFEEMAA